MADDPKVKDAKTPTTHDKPWWVEMSAAVPSWARWVTGIGLVMMLVSGAATAAYGTENGRRLMNVFFRRTIPNKAKKIWSWTEGQFHLAGVMIIITFTLMLLIDAFVLLQFGRQELHFLGWSWKNTVINRVIGGMPLMMLLQLFLFIPLVIMSRWLIGVGIVESFVRRDAMDDGFVVRIVRFVSKLNGWHSSGFAAAALPPFHMWPELLAVGAVIVPSWPYFCNAWRSGESEHFRRIKMAIMGWVTADVVLLAILQPIVKAPFMLFYTGHFYYGHLSWASFNWVGMVVTTIFLTQVAVAWTSGARQTDFDQAVAAEKVDNANLRRLARRRRLIKRGVLEASDVAQLASMTSTAPSPVFKSDQGNQVINGRYPQPRSRTPFENLLRALGAFALVGAVCILANQYFFKNGSPMIPATMSTVIYACAALGVIGLLLGYLGQLNPNRA